MNRVRSLLLAVGLASLTVAGTAAAQARGPLSAGDSHGQRGRTLEASKAEASAPKQREKSSRDKGRKLSGANAARSAPVKGR